MEEEGEQAWNAAVAEMDEATFYHRFEWRKVITDHFGFQPLYLYAEDDNGISGLLPLFLVRGLLRKTALISVPLCVYGGVVARSDEVAAALENSAVQYGNKYGVAYIELRGIERISEGWVDNDQYATFRKPLSEMEEENLNAIPRKQRAEIRKAQTIGLITEVNRDLEPFYSVYTTSMRNLGSPVFSRRYYQSLLDVFQDQCNVLTVSKDNQPLASVLNFYFKDQVLPFYGGGYPEARPTNAFPFMYWELMRHSAARGIKLFDFGRSIRNTGAYAFKKNFGFEPQTLHYQQRLVGGKSFPDLNPDNPVYKNLITLWKKLPIPLANRLGPLVAKSIV